MLTDPLVAFIVGMAVGCASTCFGVWLEARARRLARDRAQAALAARFRNRYSEPPKC